MAPDIELDLQSNENEVEQNVDQNDQESLSVDVTDSEGEQVDISPESQEQTVEVSVEADDEEIAQTIATAENAAAAAQEAARQAAQAANDAETYAMQTRSAVNNINNNLGEVEDAVMGIRNRVNALESGAANHVANGDVEDGVAYFYNEAGDTLFTITGIGGGGSGGGGGDVAGSVVTLTNTTGWASTTVAENVDVILSFTWSSIEDGSPTGQGVMTVEIGGITKESRNIAQGSFTVNVKDYLNRGDNRVVVRVTDGYGKSKWKQFNVTVEQLRLESTFDDSEIQSGALTFTFTPYGAFSKTVHFELDGTELDPMVTTISGRQMSQIIRQQTHGAHQLRVWFTASINGQTVTSNVLTYDIMWVTAGNNTPIISSSFSQNIVDQYTTLTVPFMVYTPGSQVSNVTIKKDGITILTLPDIGREMQSFQTRMDTTGNHTLTIHSGTAVKTIGLQVNEAEMNAEAETEDLKLFLTSRGRSNLEANPAVWEFIDADSNTISATLSGFNFVSNGWVRDDDNATVLRVNAGATVTIPFKPFENDFRNTGYTIELEFAARDVRDYNNVIIQCFTDANRGFMVGPQIAFIRSEQSQLSVQFKDEDHVRVSFVIQKRSENRLLMAYINGIPSRVVQYPSNDDFTQVGPVNIVIGGEMATVDIYNIRVYANDLTGEQILNNWIADTHDGELMLQRFSRNNVYDAYGNIAISKLPGNLPYMVIECEELPQYKGDKKTCSGRFVNPIDPTKSFEFTGCQINVQGTSSAVYPRKNYDMQFKNGFEMSNGQHESDFQMVSTVKPFNRFVMKADVASSEGANNVELVKLYCDMTPYKTREMLADSQVRQGIYGFPIVIFWTNTSNNQTTFIGKYNFNFPKRAPAPYGYHDEMESWEFQNNTSNLMLFKSDYFDETMREDPTTGDIKETWRYDYEARFPDDTWTDYTKLQELQSFIYSTYREEATGDAITPVTIDDVTYEYDTAAYRLAKFKAHIGDYAEIDSLVFYYIFTEFFLLADSRAKNLFIGFSGSDTDPSLNLAIDRKAVCEPYDMDTALGINNEGSLTFTYSLEDTDHTGNGRDVFTGQSSVLWNNLRDAFPNEIRRMYQSLRSNGILTYANVEQRFEDHQAFWPEAVWIEDSQYKYIYPLTSPDPGKEPTDAYLEMMLGSKMEQRRWWLSNRFKYMDSKWSSGDALSEVIQFRAYARSSLTITPYSDLYVTVKYGSYTGQEKTPQGTPVEIEVPIDNLSDTETYIYSATQIADVGDLSAFKLGWADFSHATRIQNIKIGDSAQNYENLPFERLTLGNNRLLKKIDCRNCVNLGAGEMKSVNMTGCTSIEEAYFDNTQITAVDLPNGSPIRKLHLPGTVTNLTLRNQTSMTEFVCPDYTHITTLFLENPASCVDTLDIVSDLPTGCRVRLYNFTWNLNDLDDVSTMFDKLDTMRGLDQNGNNTENAQVFGNIHVVTAEGSQIASIQARYPDVRITYDHVTSNVYYYSWDGETLIATKSYVDGVGELYTGSPSRTSTEQYTFTFVGWALSTDAQAANPSAFDNVAADRRVYAAYSRTLREYTVTFVRAAIDGGGTLQTIQNVPYGTTPVYTGNTPTSTNSDGGIYTFEGWTPSVGPITGNTTYTAVFYDSSVQITYMVGSSQYAIEKIQSGTNAQGPSSNPTKASTVSTTYTFSGWSSNPNSTTPDANALNNVTSNRTLYAVFAESVRLYTITFVKANEDGGGTLQTLQVAYGTVPAYSGSNPTSSRTGYLFTGWAPSIAAVTGSQTYTATFALDVGLTRPLIKKTISGAIENSEITTIGPYAFTSCTKLTTVSFPAATTIGASAFEGCTVLTTVSTPSVTSIGASAFTNCSSLTTVSFPAATSIGSYAFYNCTKLTTASFPVATSIGQYAFANCRSLTTVSFQSVTRIDLYAFQGCSALTTVSFPAATTIGNYAFAYCTSLTTVSIPAATTIAQYAFQGCRSLTTVSFPSVTRIDHYAFQGCSALTTVSFPALESTGAYAFRECSALTAVLFPAIITISTGTFQSCSALTTASFPVATTISNSAFYNCPALTAVILANSSIRASFGTNVFNGASSAILYVADELLASYKAYGNLASMSASRIKPISELPS